MALINKLSLCISFLLILCSTRIVHGQAILFKVTDFGAIPDGKTDNSAAFLKTWEKACATYAAGVLVPGGGTFLVRTASFEGPCNGETIFQVIGNIVATRDPTLASRYWIRYYRIDGLKLLGGATFDGQGQGAFAWPQNKCHGSYNCNRLPASIKMSNLKNSEISGIKSLNSKGFHIHMIGSHSVVVQNVQISAPADSPNTDGIHIGRSNGINIFNSTISTGDDCISLGDGNTNININRVDCGPGHGISIGSLGKYNKEQDVSGITVTNCTITKTTNGLRIKTWSQTPSVRPIIVSNVTFKNIFLNDVQNPIIIDQHYCPNSHCKAIGESEVSIQSVKFINITGTSATDVAVKLECSKKRPCKGIELSGLDLKLTGTGQSTKATCSNAKTIKQEHNVPANC